MSHCCIFNFVSIGDEIVAGDDLYGGSDRLLSNVVPRSGVVVKLVFTTYTGSLIVLL